MSEIRSKMYIGLHVKCLYSCPILMTFDFLGGRFSKNPQISNFMKIRPVEAELFHADGRTDMTKPIVAFRNYANAPKSEISELQNSLAKSTTACGGCAFPIACYCITLISAETPLVHHAGRCFLTNFPVAI
jgi:hypothetical protein